MVPDELRQGDTTTKKVLVGESAKINTVTFFLKQMSLSLSKLILGGCNRNKTRPWRPQIQF